MTDTYLSWSAHTPQSGVLRHGGMARNRCDQGVEWRPTDLRHDLRFSKRCAEVVEQRIRLRDSFAFAARGFEV